MSVGAIEKQIRQIIGLLDRRQLLRKAVKKGIKKKDTPRGFRFLFRHHTARILGWRDRVPEGHPHGFSAELNQALRIQHWPDIDAGMRVSCIFLLFYVVDSFRLWWSSMEYSASASVLNISYMTASPPVEVASSR